MTRNFLFVWGTRNSLGYSGHRSRIAAPDEADQYPECDKTGSEGDVMSWIILIASGALEAVWATALGKSEGLSKLWPSVIFFVGLAGSMAGLAFAMREIPTGTAYAVWVGIGASLTVVWAMITGDTDVSWVRILLLLGLVGCIVGLKLVDSGHE